FVLFLITDSSPTAIYTLSLHDALPISAPIFPTSAVSLEFPQPEPVARPLVVTWQQILLGVYLLGLCLLLLRLAIGTMRAHKLVRSEEHTSELQSRFDLVCRLLLEKKKK